MGEALPQIGSGGDGRKHPGQIGAQLAQELDLEELQPAPPMSTANAVRSQAAKVNRPDRSVMASAVLATGSSARTLKRPLSFRLCNQYSTAQRGAREGCVEKID